MNGPDVKLSELYQEVILDHNKKPRNFKKLENANRTAHGVNPLCGDDYHLYIDVEGGVIRGVGFEGSGCAISKSSASIMTTMVEQKDVKEVGELKDLFLAMLTKDQKPDAKLGKLKIFEGVKQFPVRVKCATLIWRALEAALGEDKRPVSTETEDVKNIS